MLSINTSFASLHPIQTYECEFSICTIVSDMNEYVQMKKSFVEKGFSEQTVYFISDNTKHNQLDAYQSIKLFLQQARSKYIIIVHQDVRCIDTIDQLRACLHSLDNLDNQWAICGNAGGKSYKQMYYWIDNDVEIRKTEALPKRVFTLDENFLLIKNDAQLSISSDISGFHFYGTDLCMVADFLGYNAYVIPFMIKHLSKGNLKDMKVCEANFIKTYGRKLRSRFVQTSCTKFYFSNKISKNKLYNNPFIFFFIKASSRLKNSFCK